MKDNFAAFYCLAQSAGITKIAGEQFHIFQNAARDQAQEAGVAARVIADKCAHAGTLLHKRLDKVTANEAASPSDQHGF